MDKVKILCPACGSDDMLRHEQTKNNELALKGEFKFKDVSYACNSCGEEGDFSGEGDKNYLIAKKKAQSLFVNNVLERFDECHITMAMFERVFELPARTLSRWKTGDFSASSLALLRIVAVYPWIIDVAEHRFERNYANLIIFKVAYCLEKSSDPSMDYKNMQIEDDENEQIFSSQMLKVEIGA